MSQNEEKKTNFCCKGRLFQPRWDYSLDLSTSQPFKQGGLIQTARPTESWTNLCEPQREEICVSAFLKFRFLTICRPWGWLRFLSRQWQWHTAASMPVVDEMIPSSKIWTAFHCCRTWTWTWNSRMAQGPCHISESYIINPSLSHSQ